MHIRISGIIEECGYSHKARGGKEIWTFRLRNYRFSGTQDLINIHMEYTDDLFDGNRVVIEGDVRTMIHGGKVHVYVFGRTIEPFNEEDDINFCQGLGIVCKKGIVRDTPAGKKLIDFTLMSNSEYRKDYIPCIAWFGVANSINDLDTCSSLWISGRLQSRNYEKCIDGKMETLTAFELSVSKINKEERKC